MTSANACTDDFKEPVLSPETEACMKKYRPGKACEFMDEFKATGTGLLSGLANLVGLGGIVEDQMPINTGMMECWNKATQEMQDALAKKVEACKDQIDTENKQYLQEFSTYLHSVSGVDIARLKVQVQANTFMIVMLFAFVAVLILYILTMRGS